MATKDQSPFGQWLKYWRGLRGMSQLALSVETGVSARHISFVETGRSRPGKELILRLSDSLAIPPRDRNELLKSAGFAPVYHERNVIEAELGPYRQIIQRVLKSHEPYPAFVLDRWWNVVDANRPTAVFSPRLAEVGTNAIELFVKDEPPHILNRNEVAKNLLGRLRGDLARLGQDEKLVSLVKLLEKCVELAPQLSVPDLESPVIATRLDMGGEVISTVGTIMRFDTARDITLDELRIELHFPADEPSAQFINQFYVTQNK